MAPTPSKLQPPLIKTKLIAPQRRAALVSRPHLLNLLAEGSTRALTLICAPPGYGKTTLLTEWIASLQKSEDGSRPTICWLSLDERDNEPTLFLSYLVSAFDEHAFLNEEIRSILETFPPPPFQTILSILINCLHNLALPICLVLDDYQFITNQTIHEGLVYFLDHMPGALHIIIATRSDPPLPLARLRARNQLIEIRSDDLRFTAGEATAFLNQIMNLPLSPVDISALENRTEGWIAGLQMAAVAMRGLARQSSISFLGAPATPGSPIEESQLFSQFIERFSGSHRYILDYLAEETINHLPEDVQRFLGWTSILDRFCAPLCDAILADPSISARDMLGYLDRANLFLIALDAHADSIGGANEVVQYWYRYHRLFRDLLRARFQESQAEIIPQLHLRAAAWYEQNGFVVEAIQNSLMAKNYERAADLIIKYGPAPWSRSDTRIMLLAMYLPLESLIAHPKLGIYQAWILIASGQAPDAISLLLALRVHLTSEKPAGLSIAWITAFIDLLIAYTRPVDRNVQQPLPDLEALNTMPEEDAGLHNIGDFVYALVLGRRGELDEPAEILIRCVERDAFAGGTTAVPLAIPFLARIRLMQGRMHEAASLCREYLKPITKRGTRFFYNSGSLNIILGEALREWNELEEAEAQIREGIKVNEPWHIIAADSLGYGALARVQEAMGNIDGALATLRKLEEMFEDRTKPLEWEGELRSLEIRLWLATGDLARAVDWARHFPIKHPLDPLQETDCLTAARVRLAEKNYPEAQHILEALAQTPGIEKRVNRKIKINLLMACTLAGQDQMPEAFQQLENSLSLAEPEGLIRVFLDNGEPMKELLKLYLKSRGPIHKAYVEKLLGEYPPGLQGSFPRNNQPMLVESLTPREREVLNLMGAGLSNRQIAEHLVLSEGTIKFHVHSILEKLGVHSRTAALARAKELRLS